MIFVTDIAERVVTVCMNEDNTAKLAFGEFFKTLSPRRFLSMRLTRRNHYLNS